MKRNFFLFAFIVFGFLAFGDVKTIVKTNLRSEPNEREFREIPDAPKGYHLIGVETIFYTDSYGGTRTNMIRIFYYSDDPDNHSFALSSVSLDSDYYHKKQINL